MTSTTIFISYSHDNDEHKDRVRALSDRLRAEGIDCRLDQYIPSPGEGWPRWCENAIEESRFVLVVCTEIYHNRFQGKEKTGSGKGVKFEGYIITQHFYDNDSRNDKFFPIFFHPADESFIPMPLRGPTRFLIDSDTGYDVLYRLLTGQHDTPQPSLGPPRIMPPRPSDPASFLKSKSGHKPNTLPYPSIASLFKGREEFLHKLREKLVAGQKVGVTTRSAIYGLGGIGKTRLAVEYGWRFQDEYEAILFLGAESAEDLCHNLAGLCERLGLGLENEPREMVKVEAALAWLANHANWLAIFDNADTSEAARAVEKLLPRLDRGHVAITTRLADWSAAVATLELDVLTPEAAVAFLLERTAGSRPERPDDAVSAEQLAEAVGCLALALEQAGAFVKQRQCSLADYLRRWRQEDEKVRGWFDARLMQYPRSVATTWETSFSLLSQDAKNLLNSLAWLAPEPIPGSLFTEADEEALVALVSYSLARRELAAPQTAPALRLHRLVQEVTRQRQEPEEGRKWLEKVLDLVYSAAPGAPTDVRTWPAWDGLRPHVAAIIEHADRAGITAPTTRLMNGLGVLFNSRCLFDQAETLYRRTLVINEQSFGPDHPEVAISLNNLAQLLQATNRLAEAEPLMRRALVIDEQSFGPDHPMVAIRLNNLAQLLQDTNRLAEAEPLMRRVLAIDEQSFGPDHPDVAIDLNNLATLLLGTNRLTEAEPLMRRALAIDEQSFGPDHPKVAIGLNNLAQLLKATNRLAEAEPLMRRALAIDEQSFGPDHPKVAIRLNNLAALLQATNRLTEAEPLMRRALAIDEQSFGPDHPKVAIGLNNLATLLQATNRLAEAEPLMRRVIAIFEKAYGETHPNVATSLNNLAMLLKATNRLAEAEPLMRRTLTIDEQSFGPDHPDVARDLNNLALLLQATNLLAEAEPLMRRMVVIFHRFGQATGHRHPHMETALQNYRGLLRAMEFSPAKIAARLEEFGG